MTRMLRTLPVLEGLESRVLLDAQPHLVWKIAGDADPLNLDDYIVVQRDAGDPDVLQAFVNGALVGTQNVVDVRRIRIFAGRGDDRVEINLGDSSDIPVWILGGDGNDTLIGGNSPNRLFGGPGDDVLYGGTASDILVGGSGRDELHGGGGGNRLNGGPGADWMYGSPDADQIAEGVGDLLLLDTSPSSDSKAGLDKVGSDAELASWLIAAGLDRWQDLFGQRVTGYSNHGYPLLLGGAGDVHVLAADVASGDYSQTNTQVVGVDEADIVKTDGQNIYTVTDGQLVIVGAQPADQLQVLSATDIEGTPVGLYVADGRVTVLSQTYTFEPWPWPLEPPFFQILPLESTAAMTLICPRLSTTQVQVTVFDVNDPTAPQQVEQTAIDGRLVDSRAIDDRVYVVVQNDVPFAEPMALPDGTGNGYIYETTAEFAERMEKFVDENLPTYTVTDDSGEETDPLIQAPDVYCPNVWVTDNMLSIVTFDVSDGQTGPSSTTSVLGIDGTVYASTGSIYIASTDWSDYFSDDGVTTVVSKFDLNQSDVPLVATGSVAGTVLDQFSMDENGGYFRVATQTDTVTGGTWTTSANIFVMQQSGADLNIVGQVTGIAPTERIQSVRFMGDAGFLVTFRQVDPLFTIDLSNPTDPGIVGELKVPGFSTYLHAIDADHLVGFGFSATEAGRITGLQLSLFDVSDLSDPQQVDAYQFEGSGWSWSEATYDHHAFSYFAEYGIVAVPTETGWGGTGAGLDVLQVDATEGFTFLGTITHDSSIRRSSRIGDTLYSVSGTTIKAHAINDPANQIGEVALPVGS